MGRSFKRSFELRAVIHALKLLIFVEDKQWASGIKLRSTIEFSVSVIFSQMDPVDHHRPEKHSMCFVLLVKRDWSCGEDVKHVWIVDFHVFCDLMASHCQNKRE